MTKSITAPIELSEVCVAFNLTPRTLKYWEEVELIDPARCDGKRIYSRREIARIKLTLRGRRFKLSLQDIRSLLDIYDTHGEARQMQDWLHVSDRQIRKLEDELERVEQSMREIRFFQRVALAHESRKKLRWHSGKFWLSGSA